MVVKALGMGPGASVGFFYWLGMTALMCVEVYGFAEGGMYVYGLWFGCGCVEAFFSPTPTPALSHTTAELLVRYRYHHVGEEHNPEPHVGEPPFTGQSSVYWDRVLLCFICLTFLLGVRLLMRRHVRACVRAMHACMWPVSCEHQPPPQRPT